ncbi:MAG: NnrS family protein [Proteobacteria bacterium]|nr:NnrS family protein [Pseudomonadota bacterium]
MPGIPRLKPYSGPALLSYGFRPFFLFGPLWAAVQILLWLPMFLGELSLPTAFNSRDWHIHEMLYGYIGAVIAGFVLTAIPNWTSRLPLQGRPLLVLVLAWLVGRIAVAFSAELGWVATLAIDAAFLVLMAAAVAREIIVGKNWRNAKVVGLLSLLAATNIGFHLEAHAEGMVSYSARAGIAVVLMLIMVIGGRIVPSFTRNWLMRQEPGRMPAPLDRFDMACMGASGAALLLWIVQPLGIASCVLLSVAGAGNAVRLGRWAGERTARDRLVLILHLAFAFVPLGFGLLALSALDVLPQSAGTHAWTVGAMATMTLAVMSRASLGHTGRPLEASWKLQVVYALVLVAAIARILAAMIPAGVTTLLHIAAAAWFLAFGGFVLLYAPMLCLSRKTGRG